jgi:hypothetical protein
MSTATPTTASDLFAAAPWYQSPIPGSDPRVPPGCLQPHESSLLTVLARDYFAGDGAIVDAGAFLGRSSALFGQGLRDAHDIRWVRDVSGETRELGARTRDLFDAKVQPWADLIQVHDGDFSGAVWDGGPIEILFIDICKTHGLNRRVIEQFFPALIPGRSIVIQQDYHHCHHPYIHLALERLSDYLTPLATRIDDSYVCQVNRPIPANVLDAAANVWSLPFDQRLALMDAAIDRLPESQRLFVRLARAVLTGVYEGDPSHIDAADMTKWERERAQVLARLEKLPRP